MNQLLPHCLIGDTCTANECGSPRFRSLTGERDAQEWIVRRQLALRRAELRRNRQALESGIDGRRCQQLVLDVGQPLTTILREPRRVGRVGEGRDADKACTQLKQLRASPKSVVAKLWAEGPQLALRCRYCIPCLLYTSDAADE